MVLALSAQAGDAVFDSAPYFFGFIGVSAALIFASES